MQKNTGDRKKRKCIPGLVRTQTSCSWAVRLLVTSITEPAQLETLMIIIIPQTGSQICMCICETENKPSSESDCSCGHRVRACADSQHPATALNKAAEWRSIARHVQTKLVHRFLQGREENPQETPSLIGCMKRHCRKQSHIRMFSLAMSSTAAHWSESFSTGEGSVNGVYFRWCYKCELFQIKRLGCITGICTFSPAVWADLHGVTVIVCSVWVESYTIQWMQAFICIYAPRMLQCVQCSSFFRFRKRILSGPITRFIQQEHVTHMFPNRQRCDL